MGNKPHALMEWLYLSDSMRFDLLNQGKHAESSELVTYYITEKIHHALAYQRQPFPPDRIRCCH